MLADWSPEDVASFTAYLDRFGDALEASRARAIAAGTAPPRPSQEN